ncbi:mediator complex subunit [Xylographa opegraphella]|nr:mediator complex subunit [Xylographa opegraphella]
MPGVLKRTSPRGELIPTMAAGEESREMMNGQGSRKRKADELVNGDTHVNGGVYTTNGVYANGAVADLGVSPEILATVVHDVSSQLPPEIEHITQGYMPLSKLIIRLAQDTFNGLTDTINEMADMQPPTNNVVSHINSLGSTQASQINIQKKSRMWDFAHDRRAKFIKILVLSQWSRQAELVGKVIDLNFWLNSERQLYKDATAWIGELKRILGPMKLPSPHLKTALEALSTGKAAWLPDLGYLPPEPLSPQQMLTALRTINTLLHIRLNLHEIIPPALKNFSISSGRVTFHVKDEFELDLSIADEDPSSQLYFIDFRFSFSPCMTDIPAGWLRNEIEGKSNDVLRREGLAGCYNFLHDLVLTHKLRILRSQATDLARARWSENIKIEPVHRSLVVQYWLNRPGGKSWVEIGIRSGRMEKNLGSKNSGMPCIAIRWHRNGKEVTEFEIDMSLGDLSMEGILKQIIALHTNYIFRETKRRLREWPIYAKKSFALKHKASATEPTNCHLKVQVTSASTVKIIQEPISGAFALIPSSALHSRLERDLNALRDPAAEAHSRIAFSRCIKGIEEIERRSRMLGWQSWKMQNPTQEVVKKHFGADVMRLSFFRPASWSKEWSLAISTSMAGDFWWVVEMREVPKNPSTAELASGQAQPIRSAFRIPIAPKDTLVSDPSYSVLSNVENTAAAIISQCIDCRELANAHIHHTQQKPPEPLDNVHVPDLLIFYEKQQVGERGPQTLTKIPPWCHDVVKSSFRGLSRSRTSVITIVSVRLRGTISNIATLTSTTSSSLAFHPTSGTVAFRLSTPIGQPSIPALLERLARIGRLIRFLDILKRRALPCSHISLSALTFTYAPSLTATIRFETDAPMAIAFAPLNPHLRIQDFLASMLAAKPGLEYVTYILHLTLPLLRAFAAIEAAPRNPASELFVLPRAATWYRVRYEGPHLAYEIRLRQRGDHVLWFSRKATEQEASKALVEAWDKLCHGRGEGWMGLRDGISAEVLGVEALVQRIDEVVREVGLTANADGNGKAAAADEGPKEEPEAIKSEVHVKKEKEKEVFVID